MRINNIRAFTYHHILEPIFQSHTSKGYIDYWYKPDVSYSANRLLPINNLDLP